MRGVFDALFSSASRSGELSNQASVPLNIQDAGRWGDGGVGLTWGGSAESLLRRVHQVSTFHSVITTLSDSTSRVHWRMYRRSRTGNVEDRKEITEHRALDLVNRPNSFWSRRQLFKASTEQRDILGCFAWLVTYDEAGFGIPLELWPVRADRIVPIRSSREYITGYMYTGPAGEKIELGIDEVIYHWDPDPADLLTPLGPTKALLRTLDSVKYSIEWNARFFSNGALPEAIVSFPDSLEDMEYKRAKERWREDHQGLRNARKVRFLENGASYSEVGTNQRDMQFAELETLGREKVLEAYGVSKATLGVVTDVNRANNEGQKENFADWRLVPRLDIFKEVLNTKLLPLFSERDAKFYEFDYDNPSPPDRAAEIAEKDSNVKNLVALVGAGFDPNEAAEYLGITPLSYERPTAQGQPGDIDSGSEGGE